MAEHKTIDAAVSPTVSALPFVSIVPNISMMLLFVPHYQAALMKAMLGRQREAIAFMSRRCTEEMRLVDDISAADSVKDFYSACLGFYQNASAQYADEAAKLAEATSQGALGAVQAAQQEAVAAISAQSLREAA